MKKYFLFGFLALASGAAVTSCTDNSNDAPYVDNDTYPAVFDITRSFDSNGKISGDFKGYTLLNQDVALIYRLKGKNGADDIWEQIPTTIYFDKSLADPATGFEPSLTYGFDFTKYDFEISASYNFDLPSNLASQYLNNQTFRIVLVPAGMLAKKNVDFGNYEEVVKTFNIDDSKIKL